MNNKLIRIFMPVLKEIEVMGYNPIETTSHQTIENVEITYKALTQAKIKYPLWYKTVEKWINQIFSRRIK